MKLTCNRCGEAVSNELSLGTVVRAWIECPECASIEGEKSQRALDKFSSKGITRISLEDELKAKDVLIEYLQKENRELHFRVKVQQETISRLQGEE